MPDQSADTKKTARKVALGAALGGALGIAAALRKGSNERIPSGQEAMTKEGEAHSHTPISAQPNERTQHSPDHPDWEQLPPAHLPQPTYWPVVLALGVVFLAWGIVTTLAISVIGLALLTLALSGWIGALRHDHE